MIRFAARVVPTSTPCLVFAPASGWSCGPRSFSTANQGVVDYLLKLEHDGEDYYRGLAARATNERLRRIFTLLADATALHYPAIEESFCEGQAPSPARKSTVVERIRVIFKAMRDECNVDVMQSRDRIALSTEAWNLEHADDLTSSMNPSVGPRLSPCLQGKSPHLSPCLSKSLSPSLTPCVRTVSPSLSPCLSKA